MHKMAWWLKWHRRLGLAVAALVILLVITGILINHSQSMGWHHKPVYAQWLARLYQIPPITVTQGFPVGDQWVSQRHRDLMLNQSVLTDCDGTLLGAALWQEMVVVACGDSLWLYDPSGELIEQIRGVPSSAQALGLDASQPPELLLKRGAHTWRFDDGLGEWASVSELEAPAWLVPQALPEPLAQALTESAPVPGISRERVLLDLHSGRILGDVGVWIVDAAAVVMLILAGSGFFTWFGRYRKRSKRNQK